MQLKEFTEPECEFFRKYCNFTPAELAVFNLRVKDVSIIAVGEKLIMGRSTVCNHIRKIKNKIERVI